MQIAHLLDARNTGSAYFVEYTIEKEGHPEGKRHILNLLALGQNKYYNRLFTITAVREGGQGGVGGGGRTLSPAP